MRNSDCETLTPEMRELKEELWFRVAGDEVVLKSDKEFAVNGKQKGSVREETHAISATTVMSVQNQHQKPFHPLSHQHKEADHEKRFGEVNPKSGVDPSSPSPPNRVS